VVKNKIMGNIAFEMPKNRSNSIKVIGVGGGGSNAVNYMYKKEIKGVDFVICNTDAQALDSSPIPNKIQLGASLTEGMGAGANPEVGAKAAQESYDDLRELLQANTKMVFITAGMGGGTGTGAAPIIAKIAKELGVLTVGIVTMPFEFEGKKRMNEAQKGIKALRENVDSLIVINNNKLGEVYGDLGYKSGFMKADEVLSTAARGIAEVITHHYKQNIDLNDAKTVLSNSGTAIMGSATAEGNDRANRVISKALDSPLLNDNKIVGAKNVLLLIISGTKEITMNEIGEINSYIRAEAGYDVNIILGIGDDEKIGEAIAVTIVATGFSSGQQEDFSELETKRIVHTLEENQSIQFDLFSTDQERKSITPLEKTPIQEEKVVYKLEEDIDTKDLSVNIENLKDIAVTYEDLSIEKDEEIVISVEDEGEGEQDITTPFELIPTTEIIENIEVIYEEIVAEVTDADKFIVDTAILDEVEATNQTILSFDIPVEDNEHVSETASTQSAVKHDLKDYEDNQVKEIIKKSEEIVKKDANLQLELKIVTEDDKVEKPSIWKTTVPKEEEISPLNMSISEFKKTTENRKKHLKSHNYIFQNNPSNIDKLEREPAFKRQNIDLEDDFLSRDNNLSRTSINIDEDNNINLRSNNSFLHDNVD